MRSRTVVLLAGALFLGGFAHATKPARRARGGRPAAVTRSQAQSRAGALIADGLESLRRRQLDGAISSFRRATQADGASPEAFFQLGNAYYQRAFQRGTPEQADPEDVERAVDAFQTALALDPELARLKEPFLLHHGLAQCLTAMGQYDDAAASLRKAAQASPANPMPLLYAAELRLRMRDPRKSAENLHLSVQRARRINAYRSLAKLVKTHPQFAGLLQTEQNQAILETYDRVEAGALTDDQAREMLSERGSLRDSLRSESGESRARIVERAAEDARLNETSAAAEDLFKRRKFRAAIGAYQAVLDEDARTGALDVTRRARAYEHIGTAFRHLGQTAEAVQALERSAQEMPRNSSTYYQLALAESMAGRFTHALHALDLALKHAQSKAELRKTLLLARTDLELEPLRDLPAYQAVLGTHASRARAGL